MSDSKTFVFPDSGSNNGILGMLAPLFQRNGLDPNMVFAMMNNRNNGGFGNEGGWFMWVIFLFFLMGWGGNGFGGFGGGNRGISGLENFINNDAGRELLTSLLQGNREAIGQLASTLNCDVNAIQGALNALQTQLCGIGNQVGLSSQQIINAIQSGDCNIAQQIASCCCENRLAICQQTNTLQGAINMVNTSVERGFASTAYETAQQTCELKNAIAAQTTLINDKFCQLEMREMARENRDLRDQVQGYRLSDSQRAQTAEIINTVRPCPTPAFITCNPWAFTSYGYGNGYGNYPNGYNSGNNGCNCGCGY